MTNPMIANASNITLYFCPLTCARVTMTALEEIGAPYEVKIINVMAGEQHAPEYRAINPSGVVPTLKVASRIITENAAILLYLAERFPNAALFPTVTDPIDRAQQWSDLMWCSSTIHPTVRQIRAPHRYTDGNTDGVQAKGHVKLKPLIARLEERLSGGGWLYGEHWSITDVYLAWIYDACSTAGFDVSAYPSFVANAKRMESRPSFMRMVAREAFEMKAAGMELPAEHRR